MPPMRRPAARKKLASAAGVAPIPLRGFIHEGRRPLVGNFSESRDISDFLGGDRLTALSAALTQQARRQQGVMTTILLFFLRDPSRR